MKISVLETGMLLGTDLSPEGLSLLGDVNFYEKLSDDEIVRYCHDSRVILCSKTVFHEKLIDRLPNLRFIALFATGYNNIDTKYARKKGILVSNAPAYSTESVVQHVFALMLNLAGNTPAYIDSVDRGDWISSHTFSYFPYPITELSGKTLGIVGYGTIGKRVAFVAKAFGMNIIINGRRFYDDCPYPQMELNDMLSKIDILSLNCPLNEDTKNLINKETLSLLKPSAIIINTSRGPVVNERDVAEALRGNTLGAYGADVIQTEPMKPDCPLHRAPRCMITPHIAWATLEARTRLLDICINNIKGYIDGSPVNLVNSNE